MTKLKLLFTLLLVFTFSFVMHAQNGANESGIGKFMRSTERSYVVVAVMLTILTGVILYLIRIDRKLRKLEKEN